MSPAWSFAVARLAGVLALALAVGLFLGRVPVTVALVLAGYLALTMVRLYQLERWLRHRRSEAPPDFTGIWGDVVALIDRIYRRKQFHKRRIGLLFREFRRMTTAMPDGVVMMNAEREIQWFNRNAARLLRLRRKADFGQRVDNLVRHPDFARYLAAGDYSLPVIIASAVEPEVHLALQIAAYGAGQKLLVVRDVTPQLRLEAMRKDFVANASHELRSPLTVITGYVDALAEDPSLEPAWRGPLQEMRRQADRMRAVVDDLIELSRLEASGGEAGEQRIDVAGMLTLMREELLARSQRPREIRLELASDALLLGAEREVHSILSNLLSNAINYTPPEGRVDVRWSSDASGAHLAVRDTGVGIAAAHLPRITERFYRVDSGRSRATGGSGLGLAIVKHALQRHGGALEIASEEGRGSTFTCHFPPRRVVAAAPVGVAV